MKGLTTLPSLTVLRRMVAAHCPLGLYYILRLLTCIPPVVVSLTQGAPEENLVFGAGLVFYAVVLSLAVATAYTLLLRAFMTRGHDGIKRPRSIVVVVVVGVIDMVGGLIAILLSGGWGSPFWHVWLTSLIIPCLIVGMRWSLVVAIGYIAVLTAALSFTASGAGGVWMEFHRYLYIGAMITLFILSAVVGYLGDMCFKFQHSRVRAETALSNLGTMLEIATSVAVITSNVNDLMRRVAETIGERHQYDSQNLPTARRKFLRHNIIQYVGSGAFSLCRVRRRATPGPGRAPLACRRTGARGFSSVSPAPGARALWGRFLSASGNRGWR